MSPVMGRTVRKAAITTHVVSSVGWLGAVGAFLVLSIAGVTSGDMNMVRGAYVAMNLVGLFMIVPMSLASFATGILLALGTDWGLRRHYWVLVKLLLSIVATVLLLLHQFTAVTSAADRIYSTAPNIMPQIGRTGTQLIGDAGFGLLVLVVITALSVFKPWGRTAYGQRLLRLQRTVVARAGETSTSALPASSTAYEREGRATISSAKSGTESTMTGRPRGLRLFIGMIAVIAVVFAAMHIAAGGLSHHGLTH